MRFPRVLTLVIGTLLLLAAGCGDEASPGERERAIDLAEQTYEASDGSPEELADGPCLAERIEGAGVEDWVVDIAHEPREPVDDEPENQCARYNDGDASHFVELTPEGEVIRAE
jgi:hypothetical protein